MPITDSTSPQPNSSTPIRHWSWPDDPPNGRLERTACGRWLARPAITDRREAVTCAPCQAELARADAVAL